jgi:hypothetical protein
LDLEQLLGLREQINNKPALSAGVIGGVVLLLLVWILSQLFGGHRIPRSQKIEAYYTTDDGHAWFADDSDKVPPFDHNGSPAVICIVFKCSSSPPFAGYLRSCTQEFHDQRAGITTIDASHPVLDPYANVLVKKPGDKKWVLSYTPEGVKIMNDVRCPDGSSERPQPVSP